MLMSGCRGERERVGKGVLIGRVYCSMGGCLWFGGGGLI